MIRSVPAISCSISPNIVSRELGIPLDLVKVDLKAKKYGDDQDYRKVNPRGYVPALELDDGALGLSYVLLGGILPRLAASDDPHTIVGMDALQLAREFAAPAAGAGGDAEIRRTLGFAAANALSRTVMERIGFAPPRATDSIGGIDPQAGDHVGMVGLFTPLLKQVTAAGAQLTVIELNPDYAGHYDGYRVTLDAAALEDCNKVLSTSTILLNHTVDDMLAHCRNARRIVLIGPSAGCLPDPLFARGVTVVGGSWITDRAGFIDARVLAEAFMGEGKVIPLQFKEIMQVFALVMIPVGLGMFIRYKKTAFAIRLEKPVRITSAVFLALIVVARHRRHDARAVSSFATRSRRSTT